MNAIQRVKTIRIWAVAVSVACLGGVAIAGPDPVGNPNGTFAGTIDGHVFELPVLCSSRAGALVIASHDRNISNSASIGGVEPALNISAFEKGFQFVVFVGGERYKVDRVAERIEAFPYTLSREVKATKIGDVKVDFTIDCPPL